MCNSQAIIVKVATNAGMVVRTLRIVWLLFELLYDRHHTTLWHRVWNLVIAIAFC